MVSIMNGLGFRYGSTCSSVGQNLESAVQNEKIMRDNLASDYAEGRMHGPREVDKATRTKVSPFQSFQKAAPESQG